MQEKTGLTVEIENDANCTALGECWLGAAKDTQDSAFVVCGTGIGGAIVKNNTYRSTYAWRRIWILYRRF